RTRAPPRLFGGHPRFPRRGRRRVWSRWARRTRTGRSAASTKSQRPQPSLRPILLSMLPSDWDQEKAMSNVESNTMTGESGKKKLRIADQGMDLDAEIAKFEEEERKRLGLDGKTEHWVEEMVNLQFTRSERKNVTLLIGGLTLAHDYLIEAGLKGVGYNVE